MNVGKMDGWKLYPNLNLSALNVSCLPKYQSS